jgi:hypothetical protein
MDGTATKRILVVANETVEGAQLHETVRARGNGSAEVHVVSPALNSRLRHWISDVDQARHAAEDRLAKCLGRLREAGLDARGSVGDSDPLQAIAEPSIFSRPTRSSSRRILRSAPTGSNGISSRALAHGMRCRSCTWSSDRPSQSLWLRKLRRCEAPPIDPSR